MLLLLAYFAAAVLPQLRVETSIFALLPSERRDAEAERALTAYSDQLSRQCLFLIGSSDFAKARTAGQAYADSLRGSGQFAQVRFAIDREQIESARALLPYQGYLLSSAAQARLTAGDTQGLYTEALQALYSPAALLRPYGPGEDPLGLLSDFYTERHPPTGKARLEQGVLRIDGAQRSFVLVTAVTAANAFSVTTAQLAAQAIAAARAAAEAHGADEVLVSGVVQHAAAAIRQSQREMSLFSGLSLLGTVLLLLFAFRSVRPLLLTAAAMALGAMAGIAACRWAFGQVHMVTLVFGSSLIGTSVDYAIYFFADRFRVDGDWQARTAPRYVGAGITLGYLTTALSYTALSLAPFPGLRQIALFSAVGLGVACGTVMFLMPYLTRSWPVRAHSAVARLCQRLPQLPRIRLRRHRHLLMLAIAAFIAFGLARLSFIDDVRALQSSPAALLHAEVQTRDLLGLAPDRRFILVRGTSTEQVLQREEAVRDKLRPLIQNGQLEHALMLADVVPSLQTQAINHRLLAEYVYARDGVLPRLMQTLGYDGAAIEARRTAFAAAAPLSVETFLDSAAADAYRLLWLGRLGEGEAGTISVFGLHDAQALEVALRGLPGVSLIDKLADISDILGRYRRIATALTAGVYLLICMLLMRRYGVIAGLETCLPPIGGGLLALATLAWLGIPANLFHMLAMLLVMGMGSDYTIFMRETRGAEGPALFAVLLATATAVLSFGLLAFSSIPFIHAIGLVQAIGIGFAVLLALLLRPQPALPSDPIRTAQHAVHAP